MKKLTVFSFMQFFIVTAGAQSWQPQDLQGNNQTGFTRASLHSIVMNGDIPYLRQNDLATDKISESVKASETPPTFKSVTSIVITVTGTTNDAGCNPDASAIDAALGTATVSGDCGSINLTVTDGSVNTSGCDRSQTRTWTATDGCGNFATASRTVTWKVDTTPPELTVTGSISNLGCNPTSSEINNAFGSVFVTDDCVFGVLAPSDGPIQSAGCSRSQTRTWTATDACGNITTASRTVTWIDNASQPVITITGTDPDLGCNPSSAAIDAALGLATVSANCGAELIKQDGPVNSSGCNRSQTRTWTATDVCGNSASVSRTATWVVDLTPPVIGPTPDIVHVADPGQTSASLNIVTPTVTDNCGGTQITASRSDNLSLIAPYPLGVTTISWAASDACGNTIIQNQTVMITDAEAPVITSCPVLSPQCYNTNSIYTVPVLTASDNDGIQSISYTISGVTTRNGNTSNASGLFNPGTSTIHWTVTDVNGNSSTCSTTVVIDKVDASIPDAYAANITAVIGSPNTIYIGYGGTSITLAANVTSSVSPNSFTYKWTVGSPAAPAIGTAPTVTVSPATMTNYFLSIKDPNNCKPLTQVSKQITVLDIRCGTGKVSMCEMLKNGTMKTVCISDTKVVNEPAGSYLGQCPAAITMRSNVEEKPGQKSGLYIEALPNPSSGTFNLRILSDNNNDPVELRAIDMNGRVIDVKRYPVTGQVIRMGKEYKPGIFILQATQGNRMAVIRLFKIE